MMNLQKLIVAFLLLLISYYCPSQITSPDTICNDINKEIAGRSWQFSFVQITDTHIGMGTRGRDYGTNGYDDTLKPGDYGTPAKRLSSAIKWINANAERLKIKFVVITGDLTNNAEKSQFMMFRRIADSLKIPYIPLMGNHDLWPYTSASEAPKPNGDSIINAIFSDCFKKDALLFKDWNDGSRLTRMWNVENFCYSYFQNFSFSFGSYLFFFTDFSPRTHAPMGDKGIGPEADAMNFRNGSWKYFKRFIKEYPGKGTKNMIFFSHYPLTRHPWSFVASFPVCDYARITRFLLPYRKSTSCWIAGHFHKNREHKIRTWLPSPVIMNGIETNGNADFKNGYIRIFKVWDK